MKCVVCEQDHEKKGKYCSKKCTDKAYRDRKKQTEREVSRMNGVKISSFPWSRSKWCNFCGSPIEDNSKNPHFCSDEHHIEIGRAHV